MNTMLSRVLTQQVTTVVAHIKDLIVLLVNEEIFSAHKKNCLRHGG